MIYLKANFNTPINNIHTLITTRIGGYSKYPYSSFNIATHVGDDIYLVKQNRAKLENTINKNIIWLNQTHSCNILDLTNQTNYLEDNHAPHDAILINNNYHVGAIMSADCKVLLITNKLGNFVMAIHAGWLGVLNGIIYSAINSLIKYHYDLSQVYVYFAPSICANHFIIQDDVRNRFVTQDNNYAKYISSVNNIEYSCNLDEIIIMQLQNMGLNPNNFSFSNFCTMCRADLFFSYRRDGNTGRIASLIWME